MIISQRSVGEGRRKWYLIDGTTMTLSPTEELKRCFPPAANQHGKPIYLVTSLFELCCEQAAEKYGLRYDVETDIENIKVAMDSEKIRAASRVMVMKELYALLTAYNLVIQFRRQASKIARVPARRLSFQGVWDAFSSFLQRDLAVLEPEKCFE